VTGENSAILPQHYAADRRHVHNAGAERQFLRAGTLLWAALTKCVCRQPTTIFGGLRAASTCSIPASMVLRLGRWNVLHFDTGGITDPFQIHFGARRNQTSGYPNSRDLIPAIIWNDPLVQLSKLCSPSSSAGAGGWSGIAHAPSRGSPCVLNLPPGT
jgi:hypothetical protein